MKCDFLLRMLSIFLPILATKGVTDNNSRINYGFPTGFPKYACLQLGVPDICEITHNKINIINQLRHHIQLLKSYEMLSSLHKHLICQIDSFESNGINLTCLPTQYLRLTYRECLNLPTEDAQPAIHCLENCYLKTRRR